MSYFDVNKETVKTIIDSTVRMSKNSMKTDKVCFEYVWESGSGYPRIGIGISASIYVRFYEAGGFYITGSFTRISESSAFTVTTNEPVMLCLDKSDTSNCKLTATKGDNKDTFIFSYSAANSKTEWRIVTLNDRNSGTANMELRLSKRKITHMIPTGFSPWLDESDLIKQGCSCVTRRHSLTNVLLVYVLIVSY